LSVVL